MKLEDLAAKIFRREIKKIIDREIDDPQFLNQSDFKTCEARVQEAYNLAGPQVVKTVAIKVAEHETYVHGIDFTEERIDLESDVEQEYLDMSAKEEWWFEG